MSDARVPLRALRAHPDLRQIKRQAKELLDGYRAGDAAAVAEVNQHYRGADPATFALHDAQLVLARAYGFPRWPKLKAFVDGATVSGLIDAVRAGDLARVAALLDARPEIINMDTSPTDEHRALHHAVLARNADMVRLLMARGADAHIGIYPHRVPTTAMAIATERGHDDIVAIIRDAEARRLHVTRPYAAPAGPQPPRELIDAINRGDASAVIAFLETSPLIEADPALITGARPDGITLLHLAAARLMPDLAAWLLARGAILPASACSWRAATPTSAARSGRTILHDVMVMGHHDGAGGYVTEEEALAFAMTLLDAGARTDVRDDLLQSTPLGWACRWGRLPIVRELLRRGADPIEADAPAWATPRAWAEKMGHREIAALLDARR